MPCEVLRHSGMDAGRREARDERGTECVEVHDPAFLVPCHDPAALLALRTPEQVRALVAEARGHPIELAVGLAGYAGLSKADFLAITWDEVDLEEGWIRRRRSKTGEPIAVPIPAPLREILLRHGPREGAVCQAMSGKESSLRTKLNGMCDRLGIPRGGFHRFRHGYATALSKAGADLPTLRRALAHRPGSVVTLKYLHADDAHLREAVERAVVG